MIEENGMRQPEDDRRDDDADSLVETSEEETNEHEVLYEDAVLFGERMPGTTLQPETQGDDPLIAELGEDGDGDLSPEDL